MAEFHDMICGTPDATKLPIHSFASALHMYQLISQPSVAQIEASFGIDAADTEWVQLKQMYGNATDKALFVSILKNALYLAERGDFGMDDSATFFDRLTSATSGV